METGPRNSEKEPLVADVSKRVRLVMERFIPLFGRKHRKAVQAVLAEGEKYGYEQDPAVVDFLVRKKWVTPDTDILPDFEGFQLGNLECCDRFGWITNKEEFELLMKNISWVLKFPRVEVLTLLGENQWITESGQLVHVAQNYYQIMRLERTQVLELCGAESWIKGPSEFQAVADLPRIESFLENGMKILEPCRDWIQGIDDLISVASVFISHAYGLEDHIQRGWISSVAELSEFYTNEDILSGGNDIFWECEDRGWIGSFGALKQLSENKATAGVMRDHSNKKENFFSLLETFFTLSLRGVLSLCEDESLVGYLTWDPGLFSLLIAKAQEANDIELLRNLPESKNLFRRMSQLEDMKRYANTHPLTFFFVVFEDQDGDIQEIDRQVREAIAGDASIESGTIYEQFQKLTKYCMGSLLDDIESSADQARNIERVNDWQQQEFGVEIPDRKKRRLVYYVRQGHGEMCNFRALMIAQMLDEYVTSGKSQIFNELVIVGEGKGQYPHSLPKLGISNPNDVDINARGNFAQHANGGNIVGMTQFNCGEFLSKGSRALINFSSKNQHKEWGGEATVCNLFFDVKDSCHRYNETVIPDEALEKSRDLKALLAEVMRGVRQLEEDILNDINSDQ